MNYSEALTYIHRISSLGSHPGLDRISELCRRLGNPQDTLRFVHVAGTNGKGSFCAMLASVFRAAGYRTGLYTSPFVRLFNERIMVNGCPIPDNRLAELMTRVAAQADQMADPPTEFELITALGFLYFAEEHCDIVVLEVGLGGRLDATNIVNTQLLSVITDISLDHTAILGETVELIAAEKAGILRPNVPVTSGCLNPSAQHVIRTRAREICAPFRAALRGKVKLRSCNLEGSVFDYKKRRNIRISLCGVYQPENAARVLDAIDVLKENGTDIPESAVRNGLLNAVWPARFELLREDPITIFDGGHNPNGIDALLRSLRTVFPGQRFVLLTGVMRDKDHSKMIAELAPVTIRAFTFTPDNPRAMCAEDYAAEFTAVGIDAFPCSSAADGLQKASDAAKDFGIPLIICGSLYSYAAIRDALDSDSHK